MHLWPSLRIRDSFKHAYLQKLESNLAHMKRSQQQQQPAQAQAHGEQPGDEKAPLLAHGPSSSMPMGVLEFVWDVLLLLSCCCCCFCCGACGEEDDQSTVC